MKGEKSMGGLSIVILMSILTIMFFIFLAIFLLMVVYTVISYVFESISIMCMYKNIFDKKAYTAWIPFYNKYLLGRVVGNKAIGIIVAILNIITVLAGLYCYIEGTFYIIPFAIFLISSLIAFILDTIISHKIYKNAIDTYGDLLTIFTVITLGITRPIFLFIVRNKVKKTEKDNVMEIK